MSTIRTGQLVAFFSGHISELTVYLGRVELIKEETAYVLIGKETVRPVPLNELFAITNADYILGRESRQG